MSDLIPGASLTGTSDPSLVVMSLVAVTVTSWVAAIAIALVASALALWFLGRARLSRPVLGPGAVEPAGLLADEVSKRQQQKIFDVALSSLGDFIYVFDRRARFVYANQALLTLFGITLEDIVGKSFAEINYPPDLASRLSDQIQRVIDTGQAIRDETPFTFPNGEFGVYEYMLHPVSSGGAVQFVAGSSRDITDLRRRAEATQVQARQQAAIAGLGHQALAGATATRLMNDAVRIVAETLDVPLAKVQVLTGDGRLLRMVAGIGWQAGIVGHAVVGAGDDSQAGYTLLTQGPVLVDDLQSERRFTPPSLLTDHGVVSGVTVLIAGRETAWGVLGAHTTTPRVFSQDEAMFVQAVANVLAEAIRREDADAEAARVHARLEQQAALLDKARDAIVVRDLDQRVTYLNKSAERVFGWSAEDAIGRSALELFAADPETVEAAMATLLVRGEWVGEVRRRTRHGTPLTMDCRWTLVRDRSGAPQAVLMIESDITERRKLEQQFLRAQRMESIGTMAGGIAHDLNNVLAPIMMSINLLREGEHDPVKLEMLDTINASTHRGAEMVKQVLSFARGVDGQRVQVRVPQLLQEVEKIIKDTFPKNVQVLSTSEANLPLVTGDPTQLHQVLINLCVNARDAMPGGGTLKMSARPVSLDAQYAALEGDVAPGPYVEITIADTGSGIPPESLDKVFEPFFTTKDVGKGTGLGLSTSLAIVRSHGGFIRAYSEPGRGTTFRLGLPVSEAAPLAPGPAELVELPRGRGELLLVVDDEAAVRQITGQTLESFGYRVVLAADGAEAVAVYAMRRQEIAAVITDMMMPVMDGPAAIQALLRINPQVRIVAASGLNTTGRVAEAAAAGVSLFLPKPYSADALLKVVRKALQEPR